jgi:serine/threonine protein kinase
MPRATDGTLLPDDDFNRLQEYADRFAEGRQKGAIDDWEPFLPPPGDALRRAVLVEDVKLDMERTWREGGRALVETYETIYPELCPIPLDLIVEEYRIRHRDGDKPAIESYQGRYPDRFAEIEQRARERPPQQSAPKFEQAAKPPEPPPAAATPPVQSLFPDGYTPIELIGRGNFGEVWKAEAPGGIDVAVKIVSQPLDNDAAKREMQSLELIKKLRHATLLSTLAFFVIQNRLVIVMELAECTLRDRMKVCQAKGLPGIPAPELLSYFRDVAEGLDWLHWQGVLHRDIKPENILLMTGHAKLGDFGLARSGPGAAALISVSFAGTPAFMAPEVWRGKAGKHSDQYGLAFTYAELRMGRRALEGGDFVQAMTSAIEGTPNLEGLPEAEQTVLRRALAKEPEERFDSCQDFVEALERAMGRTSHRRPMPSGMRMQSTEPVASTERTERPIEAPKQVLSSVDKTVEHGGTAPKAPVVWKPPGPKPATGGGTSNIILIVLVGLGVLAGAAVGGYVFFGSSHGDGVKTEPSSLVASSNAAPTSADKPPPPPPPPEVIVPAGFVAIGDQKQKIGDKEYAARISPSRAASEFAFRLLVRPVGPPFYLAENKVTNGLFKAFRQDNPGGETKCQDDDPLLPAMNVTFAEAKACAAWLQGLLPTPEQLDYAAGWHRREGRAGAFERWPSDTIGVKISRPLPVNRQTDDVSPLGIRDLSGNGREWTRKEIRIAGEPFAVLRGRMFTLSTPLTYAQLEEERDDRNAQTQRPTVASPYTGFRVVVELK